MWCLAHIPLVLQLVFAAEVAGLPAERQIDICAQVQAESAWRPAAASKYAGGLAQFTPPTQGDWYPRTKPSCKGVALTNPACSLRANRIYMDWLLNRYRGAWSKRDQLAFALAAYNGGAGWIDQRESPVQSNDRV